MLRRIAPAIGLFILSPLVAEFLLGNISIAALPIALVLAPIYGGGAVAIREAARRAGKGWPTIFLLALAYAAIEEGLVCQTLFNPSYFGFELLREANIPFLGMGMWWTLYVLTLHTVWSISVPIAIVESLVPERATTPWLGRPGLAVVLVLYVIGCVLSFWGTYTQEHFMATTAQQLGIGAFSGALIAAALTVGQLRIHSDRAVPSPWQVGAFALLISSAFMAARYVLTDWPIVFGYLLLFGIAAVMIVRWSGRRSWGAAHRLALAGGALLAYAWHSFPEKPVIGAGGTIDLIGNAIFSIGAVVLLVAAGRAVRRANVEHAAPEPRVSVEMNAGRQTP
jgi:hypothetical protein